MSGYKMRLMDPDNSKADKRDEESDDLAVHGSMILVAMRREHPAAFVAHSTSVTSSLSKCGSTTSVWLV
jgi:hypothetical protein